MKSPIHWHLQRLASKPLLILLDYDGTLTDFKKNPELSRISPSIQTLLRKLHRQHRVIMVTGRFVKSLEKVSGLKGIPIVGTHGFEAKNLPGGLRFAPLSLQRRYQKEATALWNKVKYLRHRFPGIYIERKPFSSTLHFRNVGLSTAQEKDLHRQFKRLFRQAVTARLWKLQGGKKMIEAMPRGFSKGKAVRKILKDHPRHLPLYAGDDIGDIPVLKVLGKKGLKIGVGTRIPKKLSDLHFDRPKDFIAFLKKLSKLG